MVDISKKVLNDLRLIYPSVGANPDLTTLFARKLAQDRQLSTSAAGAASPTDGTLYAGNDIENEAAAYFKNVSDW